MLPVLRSYVAAPLWRRLRLAKLNVMQSAREPFECPICRYRGPFLDLPDRTSPRRHAVCVGCGALERHRLQWLVLFRLPEARRFAEMRALHFAPEKWFVPRFRRVFRQYETADLSGVEVDYQADLCDMPEFADASYDLVYASHVLEHIQDDDSAIANIARVLKPGGVAVLAVPTVAKATVEYGAPNPFDTGHVRAPGPDYYDKLGRWFAEVETFDSDEFPPQYQTYIYEDRTGYPNARVPLRPAMPGLKHRDVLAVCRK